MQENPTLHVVTDRIDHSTTQAANMTSSSLEFDASDIPSFVAENNTHEYMKYMTFLYLDGYLSDEFTRQSERLQNGLTKADEEMQIEMQMRKEKLQMEELERTAIFTAVKTDSNNYNDHIQLQSLRTDRLCNHNLKYLKFPYKKFKASSDLIQIDNIPYWSGEMNHVRKNNYDDTVEVVDMGEMKILEPDAYQKTLITFRVYPCVAVTMYNPHTRFIGLAHLQGGPVGERIGLPDDLLENSLISFVEKFGIKEEHTKDVQVNLFGGCGYPDMLIKIINFFQERGFTINASNIHSGDNTPVYSYDYEGCDSQDIDSKNNILNIGIGPDGETFIYSHISLLFDEGAIPDRSQFNQAEQVYLKVIGKDSSKKFIVKSNAVENHPGYYYYPIMNAKSVFEYFKPQNPLSGDGPNAFKKEFLEFLERKRRYCDDPYEQINSLILEANRVIK